MNRLLSVVAVSIFLLMAPACSSKSPRTPPGIEGNRIINALKDLSSAYEKKDLSGFMHLVSDEYPEKQAFASSLESVFSRYKSIQFAVHFSNMLITVEDRGMTRAAFNWNGSWESPGGNTLRNSGRTIFVFEPKGAVLVLIEGRNPFLPQPAEQRP